MKLMRWMMTMAAARATYRQRITLAWLMLTLGPVLAGCGAGGGNPDDTFSRFLVAPDKYVLYNCAQLEEVSAGFTLREKELVALSAKAGSGSGGRFVTAMVYRPEYLELRGNMNEVRSAAAAKQCTFTPGAETVAAPASTNPFR